MKVMCIHGSVKELYGKTVATENTPVWGEIYTVIDEIEWEGMIFYELEEFPTSERYAQDLFAPLSNIDERVIHNIKADEIFSELEVSEG